jgi:hypothetical protein
VNSLEKPIVRIAQLEPFPWLATLEALQSPQDLACLAPKRDLIPAQPVERIVRQVGQADKGACEIIGLTTRAGSQWWTRLKAADRPGLALRDLVLGRNGFSTKVVVIIWRFR